ncbi:DUF1904 domain-containing protein [Vibrio sp. SM6]|uniref:DUF1904 domain-containing protein n=1 Tax=Vibrio agarilyticus TaxID=2726741 RepID=A0A7X8YI15_9VIBR|nr:DUF1904 domain-containing protein [Vibrio agarilyticus]NLS14244.1 DUF1904 domain-containing protein [Vibrio agarilyticus]
MPHFRFRAVQPDLVQTIAKPLTDTLAPVMNSPREDFTFEYIPSTFFFDDAISAAYPFVEILWFDRGQSTQDHVAKTVTAQVRDALGADVNVAVIFTALVPSAYYDNAVHYGNP